MEGFLEEAIFKDPEGGEATSQVNFWGKSMPGRGNRNWKCLPRCVLEHHDKGER